MSTETVEQQPVEIESSNGSEAGASAGSGAVESISVENPATGESVGSIEKLDADAVRALADAARAAQPGWSAIGFRARGAVFNRARRWLLDNRERFARTIIDETGKTNEDAGLELAVALESFAYWAKHAEKYLRDERISARSPMVLGRKVITRYEPVGLVGVIGPWNYPLVNAFCDCVPALMAGNSVLLKPSEVTPLTIFLVAEMMEASGLPKGVLGIATGDGETGAAMIDNVDYVMFTGSTATGRKVMERAARNLTPASLELGGKDPMIVLADANLERATNAAAYFSMNNGGQVCISVERVYVEEPIYDEFLAKVTEKVKALRQGPDSSPGSTEVGAVTFAPQLSIIEAHVADAVAKGAKIVTGGKRAEHGGGRYFEPTILVDVDHSMDCMTEETFGPTMPIMKVRDAEQAIELANDCKYGLQASVWTRDNARGEQIARRIEAGACLVNDAQINYAAFGAPMGGWKTSGVGSRHGSNGIRKYCKTQTLSVNRMPTKREPYMFPYSKRTTNLLNRATKFVHRRAG